MGKNALKRKWLDFDACALRLIAVDPWVQVLREIASLKIDPNLN